VPEATTESINLADAGQRYLGSLQAAARQEQTAEITRFVRWYGGDRPINSLIGAMIERYAEENTRATDAARRMDVLRAFLAYAKRTGMTADNLAVHIRVRRAASSSSGNDTLNSDKIEMTAEGRSALEQELESLRAQRPKIAEALRSAMADKDFRENAPLDAAREQQAHLEARIRELESMLKRATIVEGGARGGLARMGARVRVQDLQSSREMSYTLVGPGEVNANEGKISVSSPVGRALVDRAVGEEVEVVAPSRTFRYRILTIDF
jgi:transcription elongation factor GreA